MAPNNDSKLTKEEFQRIMNKENEPAIDISTPQIRSNEHLKVKPDLSRFSEEALIEIDSYLQKLTTIKLVEYFDRLTNFSDPNDKYDCDEYTAGHELNVLTYRGGERLKIDQWAYLVRKEIIKRQENS
jgi:hypothetical protein